MPFECKTNCGEQIFSPSSKFKHVRLVDILPTVGQCHFTGGVNFEWSFGFARWSLCYALRTEWFLFVMMLDFRSLFCQLTLVVLIINLWFTSRDERSGTGRFALELILSWCGLASCSVQQWNENRYFVLSHMKFYLCIFAVFPSSNNNIVNPSFE